MLGFNFVSGQRPKPNKDGRIATTLEWAKRLTGGEVLKGEAPFGEKLPNPDAGFTQVSGVANANGIDRISSSGVVLQDGAP